MNEVLHERLEQVINLIPKFSWHLMDEAQRDELMVGIVLPRYMATTSDGTKLTPSTWAAILGTTQAAIANRVLRLRKAAKPDAEGISTSLTDNDRARLRGTKSVLAKKPDAVAALVESLPLETKVEVAKALAASTKSTPVSGKRQKASAAASAPLTRAVNSFAAVVGTVSLIDRATDEINKAVASSGLEPDALRQVEEAIDRLVAALDFAKSMAGEVTE